jgi:hypothetical protein
MQGLVLIRTPTFAPILDKNWFLNRIEACEKRLAEVCAASLSLARARSLFVMYVCIYIGPRGLSRYMVPDSAMKTVVSPDASGPPSNIVLVLLASLCTSEGSSPLPSGMVGQMPQRNSCPLSRRRSVWDAQRESCQPGAVPAADCWHPPGVRGGGGGSRSSCSHTHAHPHFSLNNRPVG